MWREQQLGRVSRGEGENGKKKRLRTESKRNSSLYKDDGLKKIQRAFKEGSIDGSCPSVTSWQTKRRKGL